jgi:hypothetical protein
LVGIEIDSAAVISGSATEFCCRFWPRVLGEPSEVEEGCLIGARDELGDDGSDGTATAAGMLASRSNDPGSETASKSPSRHRSAGHVSDRKGSTPK